MSKWSNRVWKESIKRKTLSQVILGGDVKTQKNWILNYYTDMLEGAKTMQAHAPEELGQDIDGIMGEINNLNKVVNEEGIKQLGTMDERIELSVIQTIFFDKIEDVGDAQDVWNLYKSGWKALGADVTMQERRDILSCWTPTAQKCLHEIVRTALSEKMSNTYSVLAYLQRKRDRENQMNAGMKALSNQTICSTKENICRVHIPSQEEAKKRRNRLEEDSVDTYL